MATKSELLALIARVDERTKIIPEINKHLSELNHHIEATNVKLAKTDELAKGANTRAENNRHYMDKMTIAVMASIITALGSIIAIVVLH